MENTTDPSEETTEATENTEAVETTGATEPEATQAATEPTESTPAQKPEEMDYETFYYQMDGKQQRLFMESFESMDAFYDWLNAAKEAYEKEQKKENEQNQEQATAPENG